MESTSAPLADYFWIAGIDSLSYGEVYPGSGAKEKGANGENKPPAVDTTIEEGSEVDSTSPTLAGSPAKHSAQHSRNNSWNRLSRVHDGKSSVLALEDLDLNRDLSKGTASARSSVTIKAVPSSNGNTNGNCNVNGTIPEITSLSDFDFDRALSKFSNARESFLDDLAIQSGIVTQHSRPPMTARIDSRAEKLRHDENGEALNSKLAPLKSPLRTVSGSIRRKLSYTNMNSVRRQPSTVGRSSSVRTSRRLSNYNSVIPHPQPLRADPDMHPLRRKFEPVLLDRYPPKHLTDEQQRRGRFPEYVPMFAFPNDINIVSSDERPRSTWHGFAMTSDDNSKIYGICAIVWMPLNHEAAANIERQCEQWRQRHMTNEERELAASLGERLAMERASLSQLLAQLPTMPSDSAAREALEDQISAVEERISLMTDLLRPVRHGAASKIEGLTTGETGLWTPRAYGILGRDGNLTAFWKEWLRAVIVPMMDSSVMRVPASSPRVGKWQPLERYVVNLCTEALSPITSKTQVELAVRELRLFARKEAINELPGSRNTDLYALFRSLSIYNIVTLFEFALSEARIIFLSSHTAMLHLATKALASLLYPLSWASIFIPVLPARLMTALDAPCPYVVGIERRYDNYSLPDDDYVLVDLDTDSIESTMAAPPSLPRQQRRKLVSLLQLAAPHHNRFGIQVGPPPYAMETFPYDAFSSENAALFQQHAAPSTLDKCVSQNSTSFGEPEVSNRPRPLVFNAFLQSKNDRAKTSERPTTSKSSAHSPPASLSPSSGNFPPPMTPLSRNDSAFALTATLREKRSAHFQDASSGRRSSSFGLDRVPTSRRPPVVGHTTSFSTSALSMDTKSVYGYAPSHYAASTLAASTVMPNMYMQPVDNTDSRVWVEGHCLNLDEHDTTSTCSICDEKMDSDAVYNCANCSVVCHSRCLGHLSLVCPAAFHADRVRAAFVRCFASLFYTYRKFMKSPTKEQAKAKQLYNFDMTGFLKSIPGDHAEYINVLRQTQAFNQFIHERETKSAKDPSIQLFDEIILAKKNRGKTGWLGKSSTSFLSDTSDHLWVSAAVPTPSAKFPEGTNYHTVISRTPAKLDPTLMKEPRVIQGVPRVEKGGGWGHRRKPVNSVVGLEKSKMNLNLVTEKE